jgi:hypothetical protein
MALQQQLDSLNKIKKIRQEEVRQLAYQDSIKKILATDTTKKHFYKPDAIRIGYDFAYVLRGLFSASGLLDATSTAGVPQGAALYSFFGDNRQVEVMADASFGDNRYFLTADIGYWEANRVKPSSINRKAVNGFQYENTGAYFRVGFEYNLMRRYFNNESLTVGVRYGQAFFGHTLKYSFVNDSLWNVKVDTAAPPPNGVMMQRGLSANWFELTTGLRVNIWKNIFVGYTIRLMFLGDVKGDEVPVSRSFEFLNTQDVPPYEPFKSFVGSGAMIANEIPGYGNTEDSFKLGFGFFAAYQIPLRKRPVVVLK